VSALRILVCDDAAEMRALLRWALERDEDMVIAGEAADSATAVTLAADAEPDVIIMDLQMPTLAPGDLLRAVAAAAPGVPIVTFSGSEPELVAPDAVRLVALHIPKTTDLAVLREAVREVVEGAAGA
jgi:DNA-binding NarL/FixJ family response regulator